MYVCPPEIQSLQPALNSYSPFLRVNLVDVLGGVSYIFRREVPLQSTVTGSAFTALLRFTHLLEDVSET